MGPEAGLGSPLDVCVSVFVRVFASHQLERITWSKMLATDSSRWAEGVPTAAACVCLCDTITTTLNRWLGKFSILSVTITPEIQHCVNFTYKFPLEYTQCLGAQWGVWRTWRDHFLEDLARNTLRPVLVLERCATHSLFLRFAGVARSRLSFYFFYMKSCGVSLTAAASAAARSLGVAGNDEEKMASGTATEIEEDFPKLTAQEKQSLLGTDRLDDMLCELSRALLFRITHFSCLVCGSKSDCLKVLLNRLCVFCPLLAAHCLDFRGFKKMAP